MTAPPLPRRRNQLDSPEETWRPPLFQPQRGAWSRCRAWARRCLDLQAASIWNDLTVLLRCARGTVVDVGCGAQPYRGLLPDGVTYRGIDTSAARAHFGYDVPDTIYFTGDPWPLENAGADLVLATETLEHVPEPRRFLAEARRCLKPDGWLLLTVPFAARWHFIPHDYWRFTPSGLKLLLQEAGFRDIAVYARGNETSVSCYKAMALVLPLLVGKGRRPLRRWLGRAFSLLMSPALVVLAAIGQVSLRSRGGNDCLGYTVVAAADAARSGGGA